MPWRWPQSVGDAGSPPRGSIATWSGRWSGRRPRSGRTSRRLARQRRRRTSSTRPRVARKEAAGSPLLGPLAARRCQGRRAGRTRRRAERGGGHPDDHREAQPPVGPPGEPSSAAGVGTHGLGYREGMRVVPAVLRVGVLRSVRCVLRRVRRSRSWWPWLRRSAFGVLRSAVAVAVPSAFGVRRSAFPGAVPSAFGVRRSAFQVPA